MDIMRGKFIVFEGIDGCGKSEQIKLAASHIFSLNKDYDVYLTREPTRDFKVIREKMAKGSDTKQDAKWYAKMFVKDRIHHLNNYIMPFLKKGTHVLCDRYKHSTIAYQSTQGMDVNELIKMHDNLLIPDIAFIFDCPAEISFKRINVEGEKEVFDKDLEFQKKLRQNYLKLKNLLPEEKIVVVDATQPVEKVFEVVKKNLDILFS